LTTEERINLVVEILKKEGRLIKNELIRRLEKEGPMARQTASNAIDDAVEIHRIFRQDDVWGEKQHIVFLDITPDISKGEKQFLEEIEKLLIKFDAKFSVFIEKYPSLPIEDRAKGVALYKYLYKCINILTEWLYHCFNETKPWTDLMENAKLRWDEFNKLASTETKKDRLQMSAYLLGQNFLEVKNAFGEVDGYLKEINK